MGRRNSPNLTQQQADAIFARMKVRPARAVVGGEARFQALGRLPKSSMNKTEAEYAGMLQLQKQAGIILDWKFHPIRVRLADNTYYEVDFLVIGANLGLEIHETKGGFTTQHGQMKIKLCAEVLPWFRFLKCTKLSKKAGGGWKYEEF